MPQTPPVADTPRRHLLSWPALLGMAIALTFLYCYPLQKMTSLSLPLVLLVLGWLVYQYLEPLHLLQRQAYLSALTRQDSWVRRWFWQSLLLRVRLVVTALVAASIVLLYSATIRPGEWLIVLVSVPLFLACFTLASRLLSSQLAPRYHFPLALRWACWATVALLVGALTLWQVYWLEVPATYHATLTAVLRDGFERGAEAATIPLVAQALGVAYAVDAGIWHLMQVSTAVAGANRGVYLAAWSGVLLWSALKVGAVWILLLGAVTVAERLRAPSRQAVGDGATLLAFTLVAVTVGLVYLGFTRIDLRPYAALVDPCRVVGESERSRVAAAASERLHSEEQIFSGTMHSLVDTGIDTAYSFAGQGVDHFLDWNFSLPGQYQQFGWVLASSVTGVSLADQIGRKVEKFVHDAVALELAAVNAQRQVEVQRLVLEAYAGHEAFLQEKVANANCLAPPPSDLSFAGLGENSWVGGGAAAGIVARRAAAGLGAAAVSRVGMQRIVAGVVARTGAKAATAGQASGSGALCGPMAWVCIPALVGTAWLATDLALNEVDEALNRTAMRKELLSAIDEYKNARKQELAHHYSDIAAQVFSDIEQRQGEIFNLYRDGGRASL